MGVPLGKGSVVSLAIARITDALLRKALRPGDYLPSETELAKTLGIGKSSVREAVKMLQAIGVVEVRRGQGAVVRRHPGPDYLSPLVSRIGETNFQLFKPSISVSAADASPINEVV